MFEGFTIDPVSVQMVSKAEYSQNVCRRVRITRKSRALQSLGFVALLAVPARAFHVPVVLRTRSDRSRAPGSVLRLRYGRVLSHLPSLLALPPLADLNNATAVLGQGGHLGGGGVLDVEAKARSLALGSSVLGSREKQQTESAENLTENVVSVGAGQATEAEHIPVETGVEVEVLHEEEADEASPPPLPPAVVVAAEPSGEQRSSQRSSQRRESFGKSGASVMGAAKAEGSSNRGRLVVVVASQKEEAAAEARNTTSSSTATTSSTTTTNSSKQREQQQQQLKRFSSVRAAAAAAEAGPYGQGLSAWTAPSVVRGVQIGWLALLFTLRNRKAARLDAQGRKEEASAVRTASAVAARSSMLRLGPTFIKLGQLLSTRVDLLAPEYIEVLSGLQDDVPAFDGSVAVAIVERQLNGSITDLFDSFELKPLAAASLGQVHRAVLNGEEVVVKVQRQGLRKLFQKDLKILKYLAALADRLDPKLDGTDRDWLGVYHENSRLLYREIDYVQEGKNCDLFRSNFASTPWVRVPVMKWSRVSTEVLTQEYVPCIKISDVAAIEAAGIDRVALAKKSADSYMTQLCRHGFFHCDPHPGNLGCDTAEGGRLVYYDFGMTDYIPEKIRKGFVDLTFGVYDNDPKMMCDGAEQMGILRTDVDRTSIEIIARSFLEEFTKTLSTKGAKWENELSAEEQQKVRKARRAKIGSELFMVGESKPFVFPAAFTFVFRAFTTLDGIGKGLDPKYDVARLAQPYLREMADLKDGSAFKSLVLTWGKKLGWRPQDIKSLVQQPRRVQKMDAMLTEMEEGRLKVRVRALEVEQQLAKLEASMKLTTAFVLSSAALNAALLLLLVPGGGGGGVGTAGNQAGAGAAAAVLQSQALRRLWGGGLLKLTVLAVLWKVPRLLLRQRRVKIGAFEPGQLKI